MAGRGEGEEPETAGGPARHAPVLLAEILAALSPQDGERYIDCTFGAGGFSRAILESADCQLLALDRDPLAAEIAAGLAKTHPARFRFEPAAFSGLADIAANADFAPADAVIFDLGVSSMQIDEAMRGFSFMRDGPLDMRMSAEGETAADLVNTLDVEPLANLLYAFGEERKSRRIARFIVAARETAPIATTLELARIIEKAIGRKPGDAHPATRSFQALRIAVNAEFDQLVEALFAAERLLAEGGRLVVVTFHSLEDRIVKRFFDPDKGGPAQSRHLPQVMTEARRWIEVAKARKAGDAEVGGNPRARSAILRAATRSDAAARPVKFDGLGVPQIRGAT